jgi:predicted metal-dependent enzyme (double-stranded beta helix superfamily)
MLVVSPAEEDPMSETEQFVSDCRRAVARADPLLEIRELLDRAVRRPGDLAGAGPPTEAGVTPLFADDSVTVLRVVWAPGMAIRPHNHLMWAAIGLLAGQEDNRFYRRTGHGLTPSGGRELREGDVVLLGDDTIHAVTNPLRRYTSAIHVYGGDLTRRQGRSEWDEASGGEMPYDFAGTRRYFEEANAARPG